MKARKCWCHRNLLMKCPLNQDRAG